MSAALFCIVPTIAGDREDDDTTDLPDLDHAKKPHVPAPVFEVLGDEQTTWSAVWDKVRAALVHRGHKCRTLVRVIERVRPLKLDVDGRGEDSRVFHKCRVKSVAVRAVSTNRGAALLEGRLIARKSSVCLPASGGLFVPCSQQAEGKTSRPKRMELTCRNAGQSRATPRVADPSKHRNTQSAKVRPCCWLAFSY